MDIFAQRLKALRTEQHVKQRELAEHLEITLRAYQYYEQGGRYPDYQGLMALADFFGVSLDYLTGRTDAR